MLKERKRILNLKKFLLMSGISASIAMTSGCEKNRISKIDNIDTYYLLRVADESGTKANIVFIIDPTIVANTGESFQDGLIVANTGESFQDGLIQSYSENYYEKGIKGFFDNFSPIQFIPYTDIISKDSYYEENVLNTEVNLEYISSELENYAFSTHPSYTFGDKTYDYECHVYEIKDKQTEEIRYVVGYPTIIEEVNPTQIFDTLTASFIYLKTSEYATQIPSEIDELDTYTLNDAHTILEEIEKQENSQSRTLTK